MSLTTAEIASGSTYHGNNPRNTRRVVSMSVNDIGQSIVEYEATGDIKPQWFLKNKDGRYTMTLRAFATWAKGRVP